MGARLSKNKSDAQSPSAVASPTPLANVLPPDLRASYKALAELSPGFQVFAPPFPFFKNV